MCGYRQLSAGMAAAVLAICCITSCSVQEPSVSGQSAVGTQSGSGRTDELSTPSAPSMGMEGTINGSSMSPETGDSGMTVKGASRTNPSSTTRRSSAGTKGNPVPLTRRTTAKSATSTHTRKPDPGDATSPAGEATKPADPTQAPKPDGRLEKQGFGFYGLDYQNNPEAFQDALDNDWVNTFFLGRSHHTIDTLLEGLRRIDRAGKTAWLNISEAMYIYYGTHTVLDDNWQQNLDFVMTRVKEEGLYRSVRGIYWDEPFLCKIDKASFIRVTKYFRETYTDKGIFICFSVTPIVPSMWRPDYPVVELDAEAGRYLTDVAYDYYGDAVSGKAQFDRLTSELKRRIGRSDVRIWYVPCTMSYQGRTDEAFSINHINELYKRLQLEANPGGIMCYTYYTFPMEIEALGNIGLDNLLAKGDPDRWSDLEYRMQTIGREIVRRRFVQ